MAVRDREDGERTAQAHRRAAFEAIALPHAPRLRAAARRWSESDASADDAVQEAFLRAYRTFDSFKPGTNARAWLFTILYSVCVNEGRRARVRSTVSIEEVGEGPLGAGGPPDPAALDAFPQRPGASGRGSEVERALAALAEPFRSAVTLVDVEELSYEEAAEAMTCPVGTLRSRLSRGRRALAEALAHLAPGTSHRSGASDE